MADSELRWVGLRKRLGLGQRLVLDFVTTTHIPGAQIIGGQSTTYHAHRAHVSAPYKGIRRLVGASLSMSTAGTTRKDALYQAAACSVWFLFLVKGFCQTGGARVGVYPLLLDSRLRGERR